MDFTSSLPPGRDAGRTPSVGESDSETDEEFFDAEVAADDDNGVITASAEETTHDQPEEIRDLTTSERSSNSSSKLVDGLITSELLGCAEDDGAADSGNEQATRPGEHASDSGSLSSDSEDDQFDHRPAEYNTLLARDTRVENSGPGGDAAYPEGLRVEEEEEEETGAGQDQLDGGVLLDEDAIRQLEEQMTDEQKQANREEAQTHKTRGNELFKSGEFADAVHSYSRALELCPLCHKKDRSIMLANRAACRVRQEDLEGAITDCTKALELNPLYLKVLLRRAQAYEMTDKLEDALKDYQTALELDPGCYEARAACMRLPDQIKERNEKLKAEMMSKLKDLGNLCLRPFGLSTNNFQFNQDPATGSYSVNFSQTPGGTNGK